VFFWFVFGTSITHIVSASLCTSDLFLIGFWAASLVLLVLDWRSGKLHGGGHRDPPFQRPQGNQDEEAIDEEEEEASYTHIPPVRRTTATGSRYESDTAQSPFADPPQRYGSQLGGGSTPYTPAIHQPLAGRPSMDAYGAFSDPAPSGFGTAGYGNAGGASSTTYSGLGRDSSPVRSTTAHVSPPILPETDMGGPMVSRTMQYADPYAAVRASIAGQQHQPSSPTSGPPGYDSYPGYR